MTEQQLAAMMLALEFIRCSTEYKIGNPAFEQSEDVLRTAIEAETAPVQEPHSWYSAEHDEWMTNKTRKEHEALNSYTHKVGGFDLPLYTTPPNVATPLAAQPALKPLTDEQAQDIVERESWGPDALTLNHQLLRTIRRTEAAHGITGETK